MLQLVTSQYMWKIPYGTKSRQTNNQPFVAQSCLESWYTSLERFVFAALFCFACYAVQAFPFINFWSFRNLSSFVLHSFLFSLILYEIVLPIYSFISFFIYGSVRFCSEQIFNFPLSNNPVMIWDKISPQYPLLVGRGLHGALLRKIMFSERGTQEYLWSLPTRDQKYT